MSTKCFLYMMILNPMHQGIFFTIKRGWEFPRQPFYTGTFPTSPLVTVNAPPEFCPFQLRQTLDKGAI